MSTVQHTSNEVLPDVLCMDDVARYLRVSRSTAYELARRRDFPAIRLGRTRGVRVTREAFLEWLERQQAR